MTLIRMMFDRVVDACSSPAGPAAVSTELRRPGGLR